jgi:hypothetical protein
VTLVHRVASQFTEIYPQLVAYLLMVITNSKSLAVALMLREVFHVFVVEVVEMTPHQCARVERELTTPGNRDRIGVMQSCDTLEQMDGRWGIQEYQVGSRNIRQ